MSLVQAVRCRPLGSAVKKTAVLCVRSAVLCVSTVLVTPPVIINCFFWCEKQTPINMN